MRDVPPSATDYRARVSAEVRLWLNSDAHVGSRRADRVSCRVHLGVRCEYVGPEAYADRGHPVRFDILPDVGVSDAVGKVLVGEKVIERLVAAISDGE